MTFVAAASKSNKKIGAKWTKVTTEKLLNNCLPYRKWLRMKTPPIATWEQITEALNGETNILGFTYTWQQIKEKLRNMKNTFNKAKGGQHGGDQWTSYWLMVYIYDSPIVEGDVTLAPKGMCL